MTDGLTHARERAGASAREEELELELEQLVDRFAADLKAKLIAAERKHGWGGAWKRPDWRLDLLEELHRHIQKGDPLDVAAYAAFAWFHGWPLNS